MQTDEIRQCSVDGCGKPEHSRGCCNTHYRRLLKHGDPLITLPRGRERIAWICSIDDCIGKHEAKGYCGKHYERWKKYGDPLGVSEKTRNAALARQFLFESLTEETDDCILWPHRINIHGYGMIWYEKREWAVPRLVLTLTAGAPERGMQACHQPVVCHSRSCINKRHLRWDTLAANSKDRALDMTLLKGEKHPRSKLTKDDVLAIRRDTESTLHELGQRYGVCYGTIGNVRNRKTWKHL